MMSWVVVDGVTVPRNSRTAREAKIIMYRTDEGYDSEGRLVAWRYEREAEMDPNEALLNLRYTSERISQTSDPDAIAALAVDMMLYFDSIDGWLSRGGFIPAEWQRFAEGKRFDLNGGEWAR